MPSHCITIPQDIDALAYFAAAGITSANVTPITYDKAATFNGSSQYLSKSTTSFASGTSFTIAGWFYGNTINTIPFSGGTSGDLMLGFNATGTFGIGRALVAWDVTSSGVLPNTWNHLAATYDGSNVRLYLNGVLVNTTAGSHSYPITDTLYIGCSITSTHTPGYYWPGSVAGVGFWNTKLSDTNIATLFNLGMGINYSGIQSKGLTGNLITYWALNETSGASSYVDAIGSNNLTPQNTPTNVSGPIATSVTPTRPLITSFIRGTKTLGVWNNMVCWTFRASQNAGSGLSACAFGGVSGRFTGTLQGSTNPTWNPNGVYSPATGAVPANIVLSNTNLTGYNARSLFSVINPTSSYPSDFVVACSANYGLQYGGGAGNGINMGVGTNYNDIQVGSISSYSEKTATAPTTNIFSAYGLTINANTITKYLNSSGDGTPASGGSFSTVTDSNPIKLMGFNGGSLTSRGMNGTMSVFIDIRSTLSASQYTSLYNLYKTTLGQGLNLP